MLIPSREKEMWLSNPVRVVRRTVVVTTARAVEHRAARRTTVTSTPAPTYHDEVDDRRSSTPRQVLLSTLYTTIHRIAVVVGTRRARISK